MLHLSLYYGIKHILISIFPNLCVLLCSQLSLSAADIMKFIIFSIFVY